MWDGSFLNGLTARKSMHLLYSNRKTYWLNAVTVYYLMILCVDCVPLSNFSASHWCWLWLLTWLPRLFHSAISFMAMLASSKKALHIQAWSSSIRPLLLVSLGFLTAWLSLGESGSYQSLGESGSYQSF